MCDAEHYAGLGLRRGLGPGETGWTGHYRNVWTGTINQLCNCANVRSQGILVPLAKDWPVILKLIKNRYPSLQIMFKIIHHLSFYKINFYWILCLGSIYETGNRSSFNLKAAVSRHSYINFRSSQVSGADVCCDFTLLKI